MTVPVVRWRMPTTAEARVMGLDDEAYKDLAAAAVVRIEDSAHPLQGNPTTVAQAAGLTVAQARSRAAQRGLHPPGRRA